MSKFRSIFDGLDDAGFAEAEADFNAAREARRPKVDLNDIKPGMKAEDLARVHAEIARIAAEAR